MGAQDRATSRKRKGRIGQAAGSPQQWGCAGAKTAWARSHADPSGPCRDAHKPDQSIDPQRRGGLARRSDPTAERSTAAATWTSES
jgi:hypothetical protein